MGAVRLIGMKSISASNDSKRLEESARRASPHTTRRATFCSSAPVTTVGSAECSG